MGAVEETVGDRDEITGADVGPEVIGLLEGSADEAVGTADAITDNDVGARVETGAKDDIGATD